MAFVLKKVRSRQRDNRRIAAEKPLVKNLKTKKTTTHGVFTVPTPRPIKKPIRNVLCRVAWVCSYCTEMDTNADPIQFCAT